jgi:hypothetical protein
MSREEYKVIAKDGHIIIVGTSTPLHKVTVNVDDAEKLVIAIKRVIPMARQQSKERLEDELKRAEVEVQQLKQKLGHNNKRVMSK